MKRQVSVFLSPVGYVFAVKPSYGGDWIVYSLRHKKCLGNCYLPGWKHERDAIKFVIGACPEQAAFVLEKDIGGDML